MTLLYVFIIAVALVGVYVFLIRDSDSSALAPVVLHAAQGGGTCQNPDWQEWAARLSVQFILDGGLTDAERNAINHFFNKEYDGQTTHAEFMAIRRGRDADKNCREHYLKFGGNYPPHVTPCFDPVP